MHLLCFLSLFFHLNVYNAQHYKTILLDDHDDEEINLSLRKEPQTAMEQEKLLTLASTAINLASNHSTNSKPELSIDFQGNDWLGSHCVI